MKAKKKDTFGQQLIESAREAVAIERGEKKPARITRYAAAESKVEPPPGTSQIRSKRSEVKWPFPSLSLQRP